MNQIQFSRVIECIGLIVLLLGACTCSVKKPSIPVQKNRENTTVTQTPAVVESEESSKPTTQEKPPQKVAVADLANGNYRLCTKPSSYKAPSGLDVKGWCFVFRKTNNSVVGHYLYSAPKGDNYMCISGGVNSNMVTGVGYEVMFGWNRPITSADIESMPPEPIWDGGDSDGRNLRVSPPRLYARGKGAAGYYGWMRYDSIGLDLNGFYQHDLVGGFSNGVPYKLIPPQKCPS